MHIYTKPYLIVLHCLITSFSILLFLILFSSQAFAATYYVSLSGSDSNSGTSESQAWKSIDRLNNQAFDPGDKVLFKAGETFVGSLYLDPDDQGTAAAPVTFESFGTGKATLNSNSSNAIFVYNAAGFKFQNLNITGPGRDIVSPASSGINFYTELSGSVKLDYVYLGNLTISGFNDKGIVLGGWNELTGFQNVLIENVEVFNIGRNGIQTYGAKKNANRNVTVKNAKVYDVSGIASEVKNTGSGIVLGNVDGGVIEYSVVFNTGFRCTAPEGPVGIWAYDSNNITIQYNESHHNKTNSPADGGGFDFDGGVTNSLMQYNYSHDNDGAGIGLFQYPGAGEWKNNIIRYNILENDGRKNGYGAINIWKGGTNMSGALVHNNTIFMSKPTTANVAAVKAVSQVQNFRFYNNIFIVANGARLIDNPYTSGLTFAANDYFAKSGSFAIKWGSSTYSSLTSWRSATGQEKINGASTGWSVDPKLSSAGAGITLNDASKLTTLSSYRITSTSPLINKGLNLQTLFNVSPGTRDFFNVTIPKSGAYEVGASEYSTSLTDNSVNELQLAEVTTEETNPLVLGCTNIGDADCDGKVNETDMWKVFNSWSTTEPGSDFNSDGEVNMNDLILLLSNWKS